MKKGIQTKQTILVAAMEILGRDGMNGFSASALAREAGISKATLFHHFATLDEIPLAAFEALWAEMMVREQPQLPLRAYLMALGSEMVAVLNQRQGFVKAYFVFFSQAMFDARWHTALRASAERLHTSMVTALRERLPRTLSAAECDATVALIEMMLDGMGLHGLVLRSPAELGQAWSRLVDLIAPQE